MVCLFQKWYLRCSQANGGVLQWKGILLYWDLRKMENCGEIAENSRLWKDMLTHWDLWLPFEGYNSTLEVSPMNTAGLNFQVYSILASCLTTTLKPPWLKTFVRREIEEYEPAHSPWSIAAFNIVDHGVLLEHLSDMEIGGTVVQQFLFCLQTCFQKVAWEATVQHRESCSVGSRRVPPCSPCYLTSIGSLWELPFEWSVINIWMRPNSISLLHLNLERQMQC